MAKPALSVALPPSGLLTVTSRAPMAALAAIDDGGGQACRGADVGRGDACAGAKADWLRRSGSCCRSTVTLERLSAVSACCGLTARRLVGGATEGGVGGCAGAVGETGKQPELGARRERAWRGVGCKQVEALPLTGGEARPFRWPRCEAGCQALRQQRPPTGRGVDGIVSQRLLPTSLHSSSCVTVRAPLPCLDRDPERPIQQHRPERCNALAFPTRSRSFPSKRNDNDGGATPGRPVKPAVSVALAPIGIADRDVARTKASRPSRSQPSPSSLSRSRQSSRSHSCQRRNRRWRRPGSCSRSPSRSASDRAHPAAG